MPEACMSQSQVHTCPQNNSCAEAVMKPLWTPTLTWIAAAVAAVLLAIASPGALDLLFDLEAPHGAFAPR